jgi:DNA-binding MarR family transcriptional regulator
MPYANVKKPDEAPETQQVMDALRRIVQAVRRSSAQCEHASGLTSAQVLILKILRAHDGLSVSDVAELTLTHQSTVSEVIGRLEDRGLVTRERAVADARRRSLSLTTKGQEALSEPMDTIQETLIRALSNLEPQTLTCLAAGLSDLIQEAGLSPDTPSMFMEDGHDTPKN